MPDTRISDLTVLTAPAAGDLIPIVDISDTTMAASGTTKRVTQAVLSSSILASAQPLDATLTALANLTIAANSLTLGAGADAFTQHTFIANTFPARASTGILESKPITDFGLSLIDDVAASNARTTLGLGTLATQSGTFSGTSSGTNTGDQTAVTGNAGTATALQTARAINGVSFDGTAPITVAAAAGTLTGATLASNVLASSLTSVGTLAAVAITGGTINGATVGATTPATGAFTSLSATGITTVAAGTAALPSIVSTTGTADTGLLFPAADTLAASTAGVERIRIGSTGNVGIGTASPAYPLDVVGNARINGQNLYISTGGAYFAGDSSGSIYQFTAPAGGVVYANVAGTWKSVLNANGLTINNGASGAGAGVGLVVASGNVGIGTTSPGYLLHVNTDSAGKPGTGGLWTVASDERIKTDIVPADLSRCYDIVKQVGLKHFGFKPGVYSDEQINDKHSLGWIAQDVQKVFGKAVSIKPFTLQTDIPDGTEEYEEQEFTVETVNKVETSIEVINGKPVQASKTTQVEEKTLLFDEVVVVDVAGDIVMVDGAPLTHKVPRMVTKTRPKVRREVIEDCLDLNGGQMNAALYGAVQCLMSKVEAQAVIIASLQASVAEQAHS